MSSGTDKSNRRKQKAPQSDERHPANFQGVCFNCSKMGHTLAECRTKKREDATQPQQDWQDAQPKRPKYNQKLISSNCGCTGHSARDCRNIKKTASAYKNIPYDKTRHRSKPSIPPEFQKNLTRPVPDKGTTWNSWSGRLISYWTRPSWFFKLNTPRLHTQENVNSAIYVIFISSCGKTSLN